MAALGALQWWDGERVPDAELKGAETCGWLSLVHCTNENLAPRLLWVQLWGWAMNAQDTSLMYGLLWVIGPAVVILGSVAILRKFGLLRPLEPAQLNPSYKGSGAIQRVVMRIAETVAVIQLIVLTILGGVGGALYGRLTAGFTNQNQDGAAALGLIFGAASGFFAASIIMAIIFTISAIERNTRHTAMMFDRMANRPRT